MQPYKVIAGTFHVKGYSPDGDSIRFQAKDTAQWKFFNWSKASKADDKKHQLRIEAIDSLETHYENFRQPRAFALAALERLLELLGITDVEYNLVVTAIVKAKDAAPGYIVSAGLDVFDRPVSFLFDASVKLTFCARNPFYLSLTFFYKPSEPCWRNQHTFAVQNAFKKMKNRNFLIPIHLLLFSFVLLTSCKGQEKHAAQPAREAIPALLDFSEPISEYVVDVLEDSKGNLWFGTISDGAARFDGKTLTYFSKKDGLCDNTVVSMAEDKVGNIWFGTHNGVSKFDGKTFVNFGTAEGIHGVGCNLLVDSRGNLWAGTNDGAFRYNGASFSPFNIPNPVVADSSRKWVAGKVWGLMEDKKGNIWFARDAYGACKFDGSAFTHFTKKAGLCSNNVCDITEDNQGNIWFGCLSSDLPKEVKEGGVCRYDGKNVAQFPEKAGIHQNDIYSIYADRKGNVWMGATGLGVYRYDGQSFQLYKGTDRMDLTWSVGIQSILEDSNGALWFGFSGGLFRFDGTGIVHVPKGALSK